MDAPEMLRLRTRWRRVGSVTVVQRASTVRFFLALTLACLPARGAAQQRLVGVVTDRETSAPLAGVYVALEARSGERTVAAALTDTSGRFVLSAPMGAIYRLRAERIGLATEVTEWFAFEEGSPPLRISMVERAVELEGLSVSVRVRTCRLEPGEATLLQRWWDEVRKALTATAFVEASQSASLRFERFEREWTPDLRLLRHERSLPADSSSSRPFLSPDTETLSERGFVQGEEGGRWFLAPDAAVLFSDVFLADHCLKIAGETGAEGARTDGSPGELRLAVEPTRRRPPDIRGVLTVDTLSGELRSFDFAYVNLPEDIPRSEAGGHLAFEYLPSGAWIVSEWWIRMPQIGHRAGWRYRGTIPVVAGYLERGGRVTDVGGRAAELDARVGRGTLHGAVYDSLAGGPLAGARVAIVGSRLSTRTGQDGRFTLAGVPAGRHGLTFHHADLARMGLPSPVVVVDVAEGSVDLVALATPGFATAATLLCQDPASPPAVILTGTVLAATGAEAARSAELRASWVELGDGAGESRSVRSGGRSGSDGGYVFCDLPPRVPVAMAVRTHSTVFREAGTVELAPGRIVVRDFRPGAVAQAVVRGMVRSEDGGAPLVRASVWVLAVTGDTVASALADTAGVFEVSVPPGVGYRVVASGDGYLREASPLFTLEGAESLDLDFELLRDPGDLVMAIEGLVVEVEARNRAVARRLLGLYGQTPASLGRRWIDRATLDALPSSGETDPGVAIQWQGMAGVWVDQAAKRGRNPVLCVQEGPRRCAMVVLNGVKIDPGAALMLDFRELEAIAVLSPQDATTFFGTEAGGGAVLLWTRQGGG